MVSICRKLSRGWNNFELMVSICRKLRRSRNQKKKGFRPWLNFSNPPASCNPSFIVLWIFFYKKKIGWAEGLNDDGRGGGEGESRREAVNTVALASLKWVFAGTKSFVLQPHSRSPQPTQPPSHPATHPTTLFFYSFLDMIFIFFFFLIQRAFPDFCLLHWLIFFLLLLLYMVDGCLLIYSFIHSSTLGACRREFFFFYHLLFFDGCFCPRC